DRAISRRDRDVGDVKSRRRVMERSLHGSLAWIIHDDRNPGSAPILGVPVRPESYGDGRDARAPWNRATHE
ncbi:MAG: hypothetical protein ACRDIE_07000, partial [Chloroflexota bacterium]